MTLLLAASGVPIGASAAADSKLTSEQVAAEIVRVQSTADQTAQDWAEARQRTEDLAAQIQAAENKVSETSAIYAQQRDAMTQIVVDRFTGGSGASIMLLLDSSSDDMQKNAYRNFALDVGSTDLDGFDAARDDLEKEQAHLDALVAENAAVSEELARRQVEIDAQLVKLAALREQLQNDEVKRAYEAQLVKQRQKTEQEARDKEAKDAAARVAPTVAAPAVSARGGGTQPLPSNPPIADPASSSSPSVPAPAADPVPTPAPAPVIGGNSWLCPVAGPNAFGDTWGAARSGGRTHEGVDMMSPFGTPLVAVVAGSVTMRTNTLGGNVVWLSGVDGNRYYYAHMSSWEGGSRDVAAGEVIGYVGSTGNAGANHLHFQIHPGGGTAVNAYPTVRQYC